MPGGEGGQQIGQHNQPVEVTKKRGEKVLAHRIDIGAVAPLQQSGQTAAPAQGKELDPGWLWTGRRHQEPPRLQEGEPDFIPQLVQQAAVESMACYGQGFVPWRPRRERCREGQEVLREGLVLQAAKHMFGPISKAHPQQRQVQQPLARIVEKLKTQVARRQLPSQPRARHGNIQCQQRYRFGPRWPRRRMSRQSVEMRAVIKTWNRGGAGLGYAHAHAPAAQPSCERGQGWLPRSHRQEIRRQ